MRKDQNEVRLASNGDYWQAQWLDSEGRRRAKSIGSKRRLSKTAARRKVKELERAHWLQPGRRDVTQAPKLADWCEEFLRTANYSEATAQLYRQTFAYLQAHFGPGQRLDRIDRRQVARFRAETLVGISEQTVRKHIRNCKRLFSEAVRRDMLPSNPFDREASAPPKVDKDWQYVSRQDLETLLSYTPDAEWRALFALLRLAGLRLGEAQRLRWEDIDWQRGRLTVEHKGRQTTKQKRRVVPMEPRLADVLLDRFAEADAGDRVVTLATDHIQKRTDRIVRRAGLTPWAKPAHTLRKNCETDWLSEYPVMDVCQWLGHDPSVAAEHYHQTREETMAQVAAGETKDQKIARLQRELAEARAEIERLKQKA